MTSPSFDTMGGIQVYAEGLTRALRGQIDPLFVGRRRNEHGSLMVPLRILRDTSRFLRKSLARDTGIVHINTSMTPKSLLRDGVLLLLARAAGRKTIVFFHGWSRHTEERIRRRYRELFRWVYGNADGVCVLARDFGERLKEFGVRGPIELETPFVDDELLDAVTDADIAARDGRQILFLGRILRSKGIMDALAAFRLLRARDSQLRMVIGGDGPDRAAAEQQVAELPVEGVEFAGHVTGEQKIALLRASDLLLFPTRYGEGLPIVILEAMAAGMSVITTPVGGIPDFFTPPQMGEEPENPTPEVLADLAEAILHSPGRRAAIASYNRSVVRERFTASVVSRRMAERYAALHRGDGE